MSSDRLARLSGFMAYATVLFGVALFTLHALAWVYPQWQGGHDARFAAQSLMTRLGIDPAALPGWQLGGAVVLSSIPLLVLAVGLRHLYALFRAYGQREYFSSMAARHLSKVGYAVLLWVLFDFACEPLLSLWLTLRESVGHRVVSLSVGSPDFIALFLAACIAVFARILAKASELDAENRRFV